jgi:sugar phosphate isomerase/epimerase
VSHSELPDAPPRGHVHPRVTVVASFDPGRPLVDDINFWESYGFSGAGLSLSRLSRHSWSTALAQLHASSTAIRQLCWPSAFHLGQPELWPEERANLRRAIDAASMLGCECLYVTTGPAGHLTTDQAYEAFVEAMSPAVSDAARLHVPLAIEHNHPLARDSGVIQSLTDALDLAQEMDIGVCVELSNCWMDRNIHSILTRGVKRFLLVQISDFIVGTRDWPNRAVPGDGDMPLRWLIQTLLEAGYAGRFDLELLGPRIYHEGYELAIARGERWLSDALESLGA